MSNYSIGLAALSAARLALDTVGHNLANASTPGFSRERVNLEAVGSRFGTSRFEGGGVRVASIERITDGLLLNRLHDRQQVVGRREVELQRAYDIESVIGEPGPEGISSRLGSLFNSLSAFASSPDDLAYRSAVVQEGESFGLRMQEIAAGLADLSEGAGAQLESAVVTVNGMAEEIAAINRQLAAGSGPSDAAYGLMDRQDQLIGELSDLADLQVTRDESGRARVTLAGQELVSYLEARPLELRGLDAGEPAIFVEGGGQSIEFQSGRLSALVDAVERDGADARLEELDNLARELMHSFNREHSTGVPRNGGFQSLRSATPLGAAGSGLALADLELPFDIEAGELVVTTVDDASGELAHHRIAVDPQLMGLDGLVSALEAVPGLNARIDAANHLEISGAPGTRFHFGAVLDPNPDATGFGTSQARLAGATQEPFNITPGDQISVALDGGLSTTVTFSAADFADPTQATAEEVAAAINAAAGNTLASAADGRLVLASPTEGPNSSLNISNVTGTPLGAFGFSSLSAQGTGDDVPVTLSGSYEGESNDTFEFSVLGRGEVGLTPGLQVEVRNAAGSVVATLDVGDGYAPGDPLDLGNGVAVAFGAGQLDADAGDELSLDLLADTDPGGLLVGLGINGFFTGTGAADLAISQDIIEDPDRLAQGGSAEVADTKNIERMLGLRDLPREELGNRSLAERYEGFVADIGREVARGQSLLDNEQRLLGAVNARLEEVRGVSVDEELLNLERYERSYQAATRFIEAVDRINEILFSL
jgi:flagellar hook-associated protein 1